MEFTKLSVRDLCNEVETFLQALAAKHGVSIKRGNARFTATVINLKIEIAAIDTNGVANSQLRANFKNFAELHGLEGTDLDKEVTLYNRRLIISGLNHKARKNCIVLTDPTTGKQYCTMALAVATALKGQR